MVAQSVGAFNDNLFKTLLSLVIAARIANGESGAFMLSLASALFVLPFLLFSSYAGFLSDRFSKRTMLVVARALEPLVLLPGAYFLVTNNVAGMMGTLFFMGVQSTLFSPAKYGILPELLDRSELSEGNGYLEFWTFVAILCGTAIAGQLRGLVPYHEYVSGALLLGAALYGFKASLAIEKIPAADSTKTLELNFIKDTFRTLKEIYQNRNLFLTLGAITWFWCVAAFYQTSIFLYAKESLALGEALTGALVTTLAVGVGCGSLYAGHVSRGKVEMGLVPLGSIGMALASMGLWYWHESFVVSGILFFLLGLSSGFYAVPVNAYFQRESPADRRGRYIAANNFVNYVAMLFSAVCITLFHDVFKLAPHINFLIFGAATIFVTWYIVHTMPESLVRCVNWILSHTFYRLKVFGEQHVPATGGALIVCNHVAYADPALLLASLGRPVRFLMWRPIYEFPGINWFARSMKAIPVSEGESREKIIESLEGAREAIRSGELVCIFAEGALTRTGNLLKFKRGFEMIMRDVAAPIIPAYIDSIWGSILSFSGKRFLWKMPKQLPYPVTIGFGAPLPPTAKAHEVRAAVSELGSEAFVHRDAQQELLHHRFIVECKKRPFQKAVSDATGLSLSRIGLLSAVLLVQRIFLKALSAQEKVGILLPPSVGAVITNVALLCAGKVPVNLNYTAGVSGIEAAVKRCALTHVVSTPEFLEKTKIVLPSSLQFLDIKEILEGLTLKEKVKMGAVATVLPASLLRKYFTAGSRSPHSLATIIFSSGSSGDPKGVMLSHANISSNVEGMYQVFQIQPTDCVMGVLPFFHSFGFTGTLWFPLLVGARAVYHYNPVDANTIGKAIQRHRATLLLGTPTFLQTYLRKCSREQFASLRNVISGAEKLRKELAMAFEEKFGVVPLEGFGCTELSPVAALSVPDARDGSVRQVGNKTGKVGHPLPGVSVKIISTDDTSELPPGKEGLVLIKGPNVMLGYLDDPERTSAVLKDGWYHTGDIGTLDEDGFLAITDRASRFSKIGGEMVPHIKLEDEIHQALGTSERVVAVTAIADAQRGERLMVVHSVVLDPMMIIRKLTDAGMPNLWIPKRDAFIKTEVIPLLGSGKMDLKMIKQIALDGACTKPGEPDTGEK